MRKISTDLGSIYSSLDLRLDKFESSVTNALQGFFKLQTGTEKASSIMDKSIYTAVSNIEKSYKLWEDANSASGKSLEDNSKRIEAYKASMQLLDDEIIKTEKTLEEIGQQCGKNSKEYETYKSHVLDLKLKHSELSQELEKVSKTSITLDDKLRNLDEGYQKTEVQINNLEKSYKLLDLAQENNGRNVFDNSDKMNKLKNEMSLLDGEIKKHELLLKEVEQEYGKDSRETEEYKGKILDLKLAHAELGKEVKNAEKETTTFAGKLDILEKEFDKVNEKYRAFDKVGDTFNNIGNKLTLGVTLPVVAAGTAASKFAMDFESGAAKISTIADTTKVSMDSLKEGVIDLSNKTGMSTKDLNDALYETLSAGVDTAKAMDFVGVAVKAAKGGFTDTATAVDGLTTTLNSYGLTADKANDISNQMLITQNLGKTTFGELASAVGKVTPVAAALGITTNELFSSLASTTSQGLDTAESCTALKAAMSNIIKPSKDAADAADALGINFSVSALQSKGWIGFLTNVKEKLKQASPEFASLSNKFEDNSKKLLQLEQSGKKGSEAYQKLTKENKALSKELELMAQAADSPIGGFATLFGSVEGLNSILMLTSDSGMKLYNDSMKQMKENTGALDDAYNKMSETTETKFAIGMNKLKNSAMELGIKLLPTIEKGIDLISNLTDKFNKLSPATQENIIKIGLASVALGPLIKGIGSTVSGVGTLLKRGKEIGAFFGLFKGATAAATAVEGVGTAAGVAAGVGGAGGLAGLGAALGGVAVAAAPWLVAAAAIAGTGYAINKAMSKEAVPAVNLFEDKVITSSKTIETSHGAMSSQVVKDTIKISEATQKAVGAYIKMDDEVTKTMTELYVTSSKITDDTATQLTTKFNDMGTQIKTGMDKKYSDMYTTMQTFFKDSGALSDAEEAEALKKLKENNEFQKSTVDQGTKEINAILVRASKEKRETTAEERRIIANIQDNMKQDAIKSLSETEVESKVIMERLKDYSTRITAEQAGDTIKKANETRDKAVAAANEQYDKTVATFIKARDESHSITAEQADILIRNAAKQRDDSIIKADEMKSGVIKKIKEMNPEIEKEVNLQTGTLMTGWDKFKKWWVDLIFPKKTMEVESKYSSGADLPHHATGTSYFQGGLTWVNEEGSELIEIPGSGPKLVDLPRGSKIYNNAQSNRMKEQMLNSRTSAVATPRKVDFLSLGQSYGTFSEPNDDQKKSLDTIRSKYDKLNQLSDLGGAELGIKSNSKYEEIAKMTLEIAKQIEKLEILKKEYEETESVLGGNSKEVLDLQKKMADLNVEISNNKKTLQEAMINNLFSNIYDELDLKMTELGKTTNNSNEEFIRQQSILDIQKEKLTYMNNQYIELQSILGPDADEVIRLRKEIATLTVEIDNNQKALLVSVIKNEAKNKYDEIELALIKLNKETTSFSDELKKQEEIYSKNELKLITMKEEYLKLCAVLGENSDEAKDLAKNIAAAENELENSKNKLKNDTINYIDSFNNQVIEALKNRYAEEEKLQEDNINKELENLDKWKEESTKKINDVYDAKIKAIDDSSNAQIKALEDEINALDKAEKQKDREEVDSEELKKINNLKDAISYEHNDFNKAEMQKELDRLISEREKRLNKQVTEDKKESLQNQINLIKDNAQKQKEQLELNRQKELEENEDLYKKNKEILDKRMEDIKKFYEDKTRLVNLQAEAEKLILDNNQKEIVELLKGYSPEYEKAGQTLGEKMADGFKGQLNSVISMIESIETRIDTLRNTDIKNALASVYYFPAYKDANGNSVTNNNSSNVVNNNNFTFNSPKALTPSEMRRQTEVTLRNLSYM